MSFHLSGLTCFCTAPHYVEKVLWRGSTYLVSDTKAKNSPLSMPRWCDMIVNSKNVFGISLAWRSFPSLENYTFIFFCLLPASIQGDGSSPHYCHPFLDEWWSLWFFIFLSLFSNFGLWLSWQLSTSYFSQIWLLKIWK
jgi:hypothetical protein